MATTLNNPRLDTALLAAHASGDFLQLVKLYKQAADEAFEQEKVDVACFFLTHAYVFGLVSGAPETKSIHQVLVAHGREF